MELKKMKKILKNYQEGDLQNLNDNIQVDE